MSAERTLMLRPDTLPGLVTSAILEGVFSALGGILVEAAFKKLEKIWKGHESKNARYKPKHLRR